MAKRTYHAVRFISPSDKPVMVYYRSMSAAYRAVRARKSAGYIDVAVTRELREFFNRIGYRPPLRLLKLSRGRR